MMKILYSFIFIITPLLLNSQNRSGEVVYKFVISNDESLMKGMRPGLKTMFENAEQAALNIKPRLKFNDSISVFFTDAFMEVDNQNSNIALISCGCLTPIYTDIIQGINIYNNTEGSLFKKDEFLIYKETNVKWILVNESKMINEFKCYKAIQSIEVINSSGTFTNDIIAWYCPEIPFSFGPKGYSGLPGLIFELQGENVFFGIESLKINDFQIPIQIPKDGKKISNKDFQSILKTRRNEKLNNTKG